MNSESSFLLSAVGLCCAALLAALMLSAGTPAPGTGAAAAGLLAPDDAAGGPAGLARLLVGLALLAGLSALWLVRRNRDRMARMKAAMHQVEGTLNALPDAVILTDAEGRPGYLNPAAEAMLGIAQGDLPDDLAGQWQLVDHESRQPLIRHLLAQAGREGQVHIPANARLINRHGLELEVEGVCRPLRDREGRVDRYLVQLRDVTEEREWRRQQPDLWDRDPVSSLPGRCYMENRLNHAMQNRRAGDLPMSYLHLYVSGIEAVYQNAGGLAGDALIRHLTARLRSHVRDTDLIARMGQECFGILLTYCPAEISRRIADEAVADLNGFRFDWDGHSHGFEAALGEVDMPPFEGNLDDLLATARPNR